MCAWQVGEYTAHVKGASNWVLTPRPPLPRSPLPSPEIMDKCSTYIDKDGNVATFTPEIRAEYDKVVDHLSDQALRVLGIACKNLGSSLPFHEEDETDAKFAVLTQDLTLCGLCASIDPERDGVKDAVKTSRLPPLPRHLVSEREHVSAGLPVLVW